MDKLINNSRLQGGIWGTVVVTGLAATAVLFVSGRRQAVRSEQGSRPDTSLTQHDKHSGTAAPSRIAPAVQPGKGNRVAGERRFLLSCAACHGARGLGQPHMGANLHESRFVREQSDDALVAFVKAGRPPGDPKSVLGLSMPPLGGNPTLDDGQVRDIVAFVRTLQDPIGGGN